MADTTITIRHGDKVWAQDKNKSRLGIGMTGRRVQDIGAEGDVKKLRVSFARGRP